MPLPFLTKPRQMGGTIIEHRKPDQPESSEDDNYLDEGLLQAAKDLCRAVQEDNHGAVAKAFKAAFQILESQPHDENESEQE